MEPVTPAGTGRNTAVSWQEQGKGFEAAVPQATKCFIYPDLSTKALQEQRGTDLGLECEFWEMLWGLSSLCPVSPWALWIPEQQIPSPWPAVNTKSCLCCTSCSTMLIVPRAFLTKHCFLP